MNLKGKIALVTGGAHRVGKGIALALAEAGAHVAIHYGRSRQAAQETAAEIEALGVETLPVQGDLVDPGQIEALFEAVRARFGRLDVLVNSAATFQKQPFDEIGVADWDHVMAVNLRAPFLCTQHAAHLMRPRPADEPAAIVNISDLAGVDVWPQYVQHGVSKAGLLHLTHITARILAPEVRVNAILPGAILPPPDMPAEAWQHIVARTPMKRDGTAAEIGQTVVFLAEHDYLTGVTIEVDGGEHLLGPD